MEQESDHIFSGGNPNPWKFGKSLRACNGVKPCQEQITKAAALMNRETYLIN
ncbi:MAG: hypothetical protein KDA74_02650 [Planctomycetaceae bacterium]|nr:hypothetical protein [Planctomycetaceae bacterium]